MTIEAVEQAFTAAAGRIDLVRQAVDHEPDIAVGLELPAVTLWWVGIGQDDVETGPRTDNTWTWEVNVYTPLELGWRDAQTALKRIVEQLLTLVRDDPSLNDTCDWATISDGGPPVVARTEKTGYLHKILRLTARTSER